MIRNGLSMDKLSPLERWLRRYLDAHAEAMDSVERVDRLDAMAGNITKRVTGMPKAPAEDVMPKLMDERRQLKKKAAAADRLRAELVAAFATLPTDERRLMSLYYIDGLTLDEIAGKLPCSRRGVDFIRERALWRICEEDHGVPEEVKKQMAKINQEKVKAAQEAQAAKAAKKPAAAAPAPVPVVVQGLQLSEAAMSKVKGKAASLGLTVERYLEALVAMAE